MTRIRRLGVLTFLAGLGMVARSSWAQTPVTPPGTPPSPDGWSGAVSLGLIALALLVILGVVARLYDRWSAPPGYWQEFRTLDQALNGLRKAKKRNAGRCAVCAP
jgi:hypothetical protein